jgi:ribose-phosphate pyrophosphokinase
LIGPDGSEHWLRGRKMLMPPYVILTKVRYSDRDVEVSIPHAKYKDFVPVLVDDIISTGRTMIETII